MKRLLTAIAALIALAPASPACAAGDVESWNWVEARVPLTEGQYGLPHQLRIGLDARYGTRYTGGYANGLGQLFARVGPVWELNPNLFLGVHYTSYVNQFDPDNQPGAFEVVQRPEIEPNVRGRWGHLTFNDRNRFEYLSSPRTSSVRYRNQLRVNLQPEGEDWTWFPYAWNEVFYQLGPGFNQNRASLGVARLMGDYARLDLGYVLRSRATAAGPWDHDHIVNVNLFFAPKATPAFRREIPTGTGE